MAHKVIIRHDNNSISQPYKDFRPKHSTLLTPRVTLTLFFNLKKSNIMSSTSKKDTWKTILQFAITVLTALLTTLGTNAAIVSNL